MPWLLILVTALYVGQAAIYAWQGHGAQATVIGGYVIANIGLILTTR